MFRSGRKLVSQHTQRFSAQESDAKDIWRLRNKPQHAPAPYTFLTTSRPTRVTPARWNPVLSQAMRLCRL